MLASVLIGMVGGLLVSRFMARRRFQGGGCNRGFRGAFMGGFGPRRFYHLVRELGLDQVQKDQVRDIFHSGRRAMAEVRFGRFDQLRTLGEAMRADKFDRASVDAAVAHEQEKEAAARKELLDKVELFHNGLTAEQRAKLHEFLASAQAHEAGHGDSHWGGPSHTGTGPGTSL